MHNLKSRGPSSVQAKGFRATVITIHFVNKALPSKEGRKKEEEEEDKTMERSGWFDSEQWVLATLRPFSQVE